MRVDPCETCDGANDCRLVKKTHGEWTMRCALRPRLQFRQRPLVRPFLPWAVASFVRPERHDRPCALR